MLAGHRYYVANSGPAKKTYKDLDKVYQNIEDKVFRKELTFEDIVEKLDLKHNNPPLQKNYLPLGVKELLENYYKLPSTTTNSIDDFRLKIILTVQSDENEVSKFEKKSFNQIMNRKICE